MGYIEVALIGAFIGAVFGGAFYWLKPGRNCPNCHATLPKLQVMSPKKRIQAGLIKGGVICSKCGCGVNSRGDIMSNPAA